ncbi:MAG: ArsA-related P-loop ATPase [Myxococcota bacterium]
MPGPERPLEALRFLFVTGKGGVGKTSYTAALATHLAARGKRVLVAMCGAHERLSGMLGAAPIGHDIALVADGVWATRIDPPRAMEEYGELVIRVRTLSRAVFDNKYTTTFFRAVPGLYDWAMLGKAWYHTTEVDAGDRPRFDVVLFDAPSTGHGLDMLRVPRVILDIVPPGRLRRDAQAAWDLFRDPERSGVVVVSLPEALPTTESVELVTAIREELSLPLAQLVVNAVVAPLFSPEEHRTFAARPELLARVSDAAQPVGTRALSIAARRAAREALQAACIGRLEAAVGAAAVRLPFLLEGAGTPEGTEALAASLE